MSARWAADGGALLQRAQAISWSAVMAGLDSGRGLHAVFYQGDPVHGWGEVIDGEGRLHDEKPRRAVAAQQITTAHEVPIERLGNLVVGEASTFGPS